MRGILGPAENTLGRILQEVAIQRNAGKIFVPAGANLANSAWLFGNQIKMILECNRDELLTVVRGLMEKLQATENEPTEAAKVTERALSLVG